MPRDAGKPRRRWRLAAAAVACALALLAVAGLQRYRDLASARARETALLGRIAATEARVESLAVEIDRLEDDPETLERLAREELGMVKPGEVVIMLPEED